MAAARFLTTAGPDRALQQAGARLLTACTMSLLLHLALLMGIPVNATGGAPHVVARFYARLEPAADRGQQVRETTPAPTEKAGAPAGADARPQPDAVEAEAVSVAGIEPPLSDATYYPAQQLDVYPLPLTPIRLNDPDSAAGQRRDGRLLLLLLIDESGVVNAASVVDAQPEGRIEAAAMSVLRATRFAPAQKQGYPVKSRVLLQVSYTYGDREAAVR